jgi:RNA polymerase sigma-70 factor (ECF subfamily)
MVTAGIDSGVLPAEIGVPLGGVEVLEYHRMQYPSREGHNMRGSAADGKTLGPSSQDEELELIRATARRDRHAFETLYYRYTPRLGRYLFRLLKQREAIDEVINDVMLVVWQNAARFDPTASRLSTWLFGIAHKKALKAIARSSARSLELPLEPADMDETADQYDADDSTSQADPRNPEQTLIGRQLGRALARAMESLSPEHRAVIELAFCEDCSYQEIATITGCPVNTVKTRMFHARKRLAQLLAERGIGHSQDT